MSIQKTYNGQSFSQEEGVSRETFADFQAWEILLYRWNRKINLVSKAALSGFWERHVLDSWQLTQLLPKGAIKIIDLGSGAGFPGLALSIALKERGEGEVLLVESAGKKTNFLRTVIRELKLPAKATSVRAEDLDPETYDVITARAFAPLNKLLTYAHPFWGQDSVGLFLKGINAADELTEAHKYWTFQLETVPSQTDAEAVILKISELKALSGPAET